MKNRVIKGVFLLYAITMVFACTTKKAEPVIDKEQIKKEIQAKEDEFAAVYNAGELKDIGYFHEEAISFPQNNAPLVGRKAIVDYLANHIDSLASTRKISFSTKEVHVSTDGNHVLEIGYYKVVDSTNTPVNTGNYMCLFVKKDGNYVCLRDMSASDMPVE